MFHIYNKIILIAKNKYARSKYFIINKYIKKFLFLEILKKYAIFLNYILLYNKVRNLDKKFLNFFKNFAISFQIILYFI